MKQIKKGKFIQTIPTAVPVLIIINSIAQTVLQSLQKVQHSTIIQMRKKAISKGTQNITTPKANVSLIHHQKALGNLP